MTFMTQSDRLVRGFGATQQDIGALGDSGDTTIFNTSVR